MTADGDEPGIGTAASVPHRCRSRTDSDLRGRDSAPATACMVLTRRSSHRRSASNVPIAPRARTVVNDQREPPAISCVFVDSRCARVLRRPRVMDSFRALGRACVWIALLIAAAGCVGAPTPGCAGGASNCLPDVTEDTRRDAAPDVTTDGPADDGVDAAPLDASCSEGWVRVYERGCGRPPSRCEPEQTVAPEPFCACDGVTYTTRQWPPTRPWSTRGACEGDAGVDAPGDAPACPLSEPSIDSCGADSDCGSIARGCFCGQQPVVGVATSWYAAALLCEDQARRACALGCPVSPGQVAQDGRSPGDGGAIAVRCDRADGGGRCRSYVP